MSKDVLARPPAAPCGAAASLALHLSAYPRGPVPAVVQCVFACFPAAPLPPLQYSLSPLPHTLLPAPL
jgi:hypothetical protein